MPLAECSAERTLGHPVAVEYSSLWQLLPRPNMLALSVALGPARPNRSGGDGDLEGHFPDAIAVGMPGKLAQGVSSKG